ncbi:hypothetical protein BKA70DRAFT_1352821, partial [Coprinopsis sp. MPI-PUGE-AT-0042]
MRPDSRIDFYAKSSNEPLPGLLRTPLSTILDQLDHCNQICKRTREVIEEAVLDQRARILAMESEIERLEAVRRRLLSTSESISATKASYTATLSAICRIPPEIVARIISLAVTGIGGYAGKKERQQFRNLRAVSRLWRQTAFSTPHLWRSIQLFGNDFPPTLSQRQNPQEHDAYAQSLTSWFRRGGAGARLRLNMSWLPQDVVDFVFTAIRNAELNLHSAIVGIDRDGKPYGGSDELTFLLPSTSDGPAALPLEDIQIHLIRPAPRERPRSRESLTLTNRFPRLFTLSLSFTDGKGSPSCPASFIHATLAGLSLHGIHLPAEEVEFVLAGLPQLEMLRLTRCTPFFGETSDTPSPPYVHNSLKRIDLRHTIPVVFLSRLICPSLAVLNVEGKDTDNRRLELAYLRSFMGRCGGSIQFVFHGIVLRASKP